MEDMIRFVDSDKVSAIGSGTPTARSRDLSVMYKNGKPGQIYLIPYNTGYVRNNELDFVGTNDLVLKTNIWDDIVCYCIVNTGH